MRYFKLTIAYDGTDFHGWQIQAGKPTIQGEIVEVLRRLTQEHVVLHATGRTDAGFTRLGKWEFPNAIASLSAGFSARAERAASARDSHRGRGMKSGRLQRALVGERQNLPLPVVSRESRAADDLAIRSALPFPLDEDAMRDAALDLCRHARLCFVRGFDGFRRGRQREGHGAAKSFRPS